VPVVVKHDVFVEASLAETWDLYLDRRGWATWVDAFQGVVGEEGYPQEGGTLTWRSTPAGRGEVTEKVLEHEPRPVHRIEFSDPTMSGELATRFGVEGDGTRVSQELDYRLVERGPFAVLGAFFVKSQVARSLERTLTDLKDFVEEGARSGAR